MAWEKLKVELIALIAVYAVFTAVFISYISNPYNAVQISSQSDFAAFYTGAEIVNTGEIAKLYETGYQKIVQETTVGVDYGGAFYSYRNPPFVAWLMSPLAELSVVDAYKIYAMFNLTVLFLSLIILAKILRPQTKYLLWLTLFIPIISTLYHGQLSLWLLLIIAGVFGFLSEKNNTAAGLLSGFLLIKPQYIVLLPFLLLLSDKKRSFAAGTLASLAALTVLNIALYGPELFTDYLTFLTATESIADGTDILENYNLHSVGAALFGFNTLNPAVIAAEAGLLGIVFYYLYKNGGLLAGETVLSIGVISSLLFNLHTMSSDLVLLIVPVLWYANGRFSNSSKKYVPLLLFLLPVLGFLKLQWISVLFFAVILVWLLNRKNYKL